MALADDVERALRAAPTESRRDPSLAVTAAMAGGNVVQNAQVSAQLMNVQSTQRAIDKVATKKGGRGFLGATLGWLGGGVRGAADLVGDAVGTTLHYANKPLEQVQQEYRYIRDVIDKHGFGAGLLASAPMIVGGVVAGVATGGTGTAFGASIGQALGGWVSEETGIMSYKDSWDRVQKGEEYRDSSGQVVSPGRDAARFLGSLTKHIGIDIEQHKGFDLYDAVSGIGDGLFSVAADPLTAAGGLGKTATTTGFKGGALAARYGGTVLDKSTDIARVTAQYPSVKRALSSLAEMDAGTIVARHKKLAPFADELGEADTWDKVGQVLIDNANAAQMRLRYLPRQGIANVPFANLVDKFHQEANELSLLPVKDDAGRVETFARNRARSLGEKYKRATTLVPTSFDETTGKLSRETFHFNDPNSARTIYDIAKWGHTERMAREVAKDWALGDVDRRMTIFRNVITDNFANRMEAVRPGWTQTADGSETLARLGDQIDTAMGGVDASRTTAFGYDANGRILSKMPTQGGTESVPILENQFYKMAMPNYLTFDRNLRALGNGSKLFGKADDWLYDHFTKSVFKRYALLSGGFALRNAAADAIPFIARDPKQFFKGKIAASMQKHGWKMEKGEEDHLLAAVGRFLAKRVDLTDEELGLLVHSTKSWGGELTAPAVRAGGEHGVEIVGVEQKIEDELYRLHGEVPRTVKVEGEMQAWSGDHERLHEYWKAEAEELATQSPASRAAASAYDATIKAGGSPKQATEAATIAAKDALDRLPEEVLNQHKRHFYGSVKDEQYPGRISTHQTEWIPGKKGEAGRWVTTGETRIIGREAEQLSLLPGSEIPVERFDPGTPDVPGRFEPTGETVTYGQTTTQPNLVNPKGNTPNQLRTGTQYGGMADDVPMTTSRPREVWIPGKDGKPGEWVATGETRTVGRSTSQGNLLPGTEVPVERYVRGTPDVPATTKFEPSWKEGEEGLITQPRLPDELLPAIPGDSVLDDPHLDWARVIVENLKGTTHGANGTYHADLMASIGRGEAYDINLLEQVPIDARPAKVLGAYEKPAPPPRFADKLFSKLNTYMNWAAREPIFQGALLDEWKAFKPLVDAGEMTLDEATVIVNSRAVNAILPHIDNAAERTLMAEHARNWIPFYAAQQQAYARMFRLLADDPMAFRRVQLGFTNLANFGGIYDDETGESHMVLPGLGFMTEGATKAMGRLGIPVVGSVATGFSGNLKSLASVSPILEGGEFFKPGPLVAIGVRAVNNLLPESKRFTDPIMGDMAGAQAMWEMLVPNATVRNLANTFINSDNRTMVKSMNDAIMALEYKQNVEMRKWIQAGKSPDDPDAPAYVPGPAATDMQKWEFMDRVKNQARILSIVKAFVGSVSPVAPKVEIGDLALKEDVYKRIKEQGINQGLQDFLKDNPDATPYTVFQTDSGTPSPIESTHTAQKWVESNLSFIKSKDYSQIASYFVPQSDDKFNQDVYNEQRAMNMRRRKSPEKLIQDIQIAEGNRWYWDTYKPAKDAAESRARTPQERRQIGSAFNKTGDPAQGVVPFELMKQQNPIWYTSFSSGGRDAERSLALAQLRGAIQRGDAPSSPMTEKLAELLKDLDQHNSAMLPGRTDSFAAAQRRQENANWQNYLKAESLRTPELSMAINNIFRGA